MRTHVAVAICCLVGLAIGAPARADLVLDNGMINNFPPLSETGVVTVQSGPGGSATTLNLLDTGSIGNTLNAFNNSIVNMTGGAITNDLRAFDTSMVSVSGGSIGKSLNAQGSSRATVSGGAFGGALISGGDSLLTLLGTFNFDYGDYFNDSPLDDAFLVGTLADGTAVDNQVVIGTNAQVTLAPPPIREVPEPAGILAWLLVLLVGGAALKGTRAAQAIDAR